jgi:LCCL domain
MNAIRHAPVTQTFVPFSVTRDTSRTRVELEVIVKKMFALLTGLMLTGCPNQPAPAPSSTPNPPPTADYSLKLAPESLSLAVGSSGTVALSVQRSNGFDGVVSFAASGAILGSSTDKVEANIVDQTLNLKVGSTVPAGEYPLVIKATSGSLVRSADFKLTVTSAAASGFSISYPAATLTVAAGSPALTLNIPITRQGGFDGAIETSLEGDASVVGPIGPGRINGSISSAIGDNAKMVLTVDKTVPSGEYKLTIRGRSSTGVLSTAALNLKVVTATQLTVDDSPYILGLRGKNGQQFPYFCPANNLSEKSVWGTDTYTDDTTICRAAVHAGKIIQADGGFVIIEITPGLDKYVGSDRNGIFSRNWNKWEGSYIFR